MSGSALSQVLLRHLLLVATSCGFLWLAWTGFISSDDEYYASAGLGWLNDFPYVAQDFGRVRAAVGIPIALAVALFGEREFTVVLGTAVFFVATLSLTLVMLSRVMGEWPALAATVPMATLPLFAVYATIPSADFPELFFVAGSFWAFWIAGQVERRFWLLILAGISAALAFSAHEVMAALLLYYGVLFILGYAIPRRQYWVMAIGFLAVLAAEAAYYWIAAGNPLHRFELLRHGVSIRDRAEVGFLQISSSGTLHVWDPIDPIVMLFTKHDFGLLAFFAIPALWWAFFGRTTTSTQARSTARLIGGLGVVWIGFCAGALTNYQLLPRYYMVAAYCLYVTTAIWAVSELWQRRPMLVAFGGLAFVVVGVGGILLANKNPRFGERELVLYLVSSNEPVHTDPMTREKIHWYCRWARVDCARVQSTPPSVGVIYFFNPKNATRPNRLVSADDLAKYQPKPTWREVWRREEPRRWLGTVLTRSGIAHLLPNQLMQKLDGSNLPVVVYRVTE